MDEGIIDLKSRFGKANPVADNKPEAEETEFDYTVTTKAGVIFKSHGYIYPIPGFIAVCHGKGIVDIMLPVEDILLVERNKNVVPF